MRHKRSDVLISPWPCAWLECNDTSGHLISNTASNSFANTSIGRFSQFPAEHLILRPRLFYKLGCYSLRTRQKRRARSLTAEALVRRKACASREAPPAIVLYFARMFLAAGSFYLNSKCLGADIIFFLFFKIPRFA